MQRTRVLAGLSIILGSILLYVAWANVGGLVPPFALCRYVGEPAVHVGGNFALVYSGGCAPYESAHLAFALVTFAGFSIIGGGIRLNRLHQ